MFDTATGLKLYAFIRTTYNKKNESDGVSNRPHSHRYYQLIYGNQGNGAVIVEGETYPISEGDVILVGQGATHNFAAFSEKFKTYELKFDMSPTAEEPFVGKPCFCTEDSTGSIRRALQQIEYEADATDDHSLRIAHLELCKILELLKRQCLSQDPIVGRAAPDGEDRSDELFTRIRGYIDRHVSEGITILDISREFCIEYKYLSRLFSKRYGMRLKRYINRRRIEHANDLIATTDLNMTLIAEKSGFGTLHHMERAYRDILGISPSRYRHNFKHSYAVNFATPPAGAENKE